MKKFKVICFPYAGGSKYSYRFLSTNIPPGVTLCPLDYPGRGARANEPLYTDLNAIVDDAFRSVRSLIDDEPYAIYGHSMGALVGYLVTRNILENQLSCPGHLFLTGRQAPTVVNPDEPVHTLPKPDFLEKVKELGGLPKEISDNAELMDFFEPVLRADFKALENFSYTHNGPIDIPVDVIIGMSEKVTAEEAKAWQKETTLPLGFRQFPGDHFFILDHAPRIMEWMVRKMNQTPVLN